MRTPLLLCVAPLFLADSVSFAPKADSQVTKTFTQSAKLESTVAEVVLDTEDDDPVIDISLEWNRSIGFTDRYLSSAGGRPTKLRRDFDALDHDASYSIQVETDGFQLDETYSASGESGLADTAVVFTREGDEVSVAWVEDEEGDDDLLGGLEIDADFIGMLPAGEVEKDDRWEIDGAALVALLLPGGDPGFELSLPDRPMELIAVGLEPAFLSILEDVLGDTAEADASATYRGTRDVDGRRVGVLELELELETERDVISTMEPWMDPIAGEVTPDLMVADAMVRLEGKGELLWDLEAGRVHSFELTGDLTLGLARQVVIDAGGEEVGITLDLELVGELSVELATE